MSKSLRIVYAGTPEFAVSALKQCCEAGYNIVAVYTQPDRPAGRGRELKPSPVKCFATDHQIDVFQVASFKNDAAVDELKQLKPDLLVVAAYGLILPESVLAIPTFGCINIHASLLPRWRGAAPIQRAIIAGDSQTGITIMQMNAGLDTGDMLLLKTCDIRDNETASQLHDRLAELGGEALLAVLPLIATKQINPHSQDDSLATYASKLNKNEAQIDWSLSASHIQRCVRAYNAWPVAFTHWQKKANQRVVLRIWDALVVKDDTTRAMPGTVIQVSHDGIDVATGEGVLRLTSLQAPGKQRVSAADFVNAYVLSGHVFGDADAL